MTTATPVDGSLAVDHQLRRLVGIYPAIHRRVAVVAVDGSGAGLAAVERLTNHFGWPAIVIRDRPQLTWALSVNRPLLTVVTADDATATIATVDEVRQIGGWPVVAVSHFRADQRVSAYLRGADAVAASSDIVDIASRILALLRRTAEGSAAGARYLTAHELRVDLWSREVHLKQGRVELSDTEYRLLVCLMESAGRVVPFPHVLQRVWGWHSATGTNGLRIYITRLRRKLGGDAKCSDFIRSVRGHGYMFVPSVMEVRDASRSAPSSSERPAPVEPRLSSLCEVVAADVDPVAALAEVARFLVQEKTADAVGVHQVRGPTLHLAAEHGFSAQWRTLAADVQLGDPTFGSVQAINSRAPVQVRRINGRRFRGTATATKTEPPGTYLFVPTINRGRVNGVIGVLRESDEPFEELSIHYLNAVGALCGTCLG